MLASVMYKTCLYYSNWSVYHKKHFVQDLPLECVTHIFYAFIAIEASGRLKLSDPWADVDMPMPHSSVTGSVNMLQALKQHKPSLKVCMSVGGWGTEHLFQAVARDAAKVAQFADSAAAICAQFGFDGVDIDWEYPLLPAEGAQMVQVLAALRQRLPHLLITVAAPASPNKIACLPVSAMDRYLSFWNVMCYDFSGNWSERTGYHSNLFGGTLSADAAITAYLEAGVLLRKLILGMPAYGRGFEVASSDWLDQPFSKCSGEGTWDYRTLPIGTEQFDPRKVAASCYDPASGVVVVYDNQQSARIKAMYVRLKRLGGGMWWDSSGDPYHDSSRSLLRNFVDQLDHNLE